MDGGYGSVIEIARRIYASVNYAINGLDIGLSLGQRKAIIWIGDGLLLTGQLVESFLWN